MFCNTCHLLTYIQILSPFINSHNGLQTLNGKPTRDWKFDVQLKVKPWRAYASIGERWKYSFNPLATSALEEDGRSAKRTGFFSPGKDPVPNVQGAGWISDLSGRERKNLAFTRIRYPDHASRSQSLRRWHWMYDVTYIMISSSIIAM